MEPTQFPSKNTSPWQTLRPAPQRVMKLDQAGAKWSGKMSLDLMYLCLGVNRKTVVLLLRKYPWSQS